MDRLLASPRYGERWGRHWLDVVRFGESNGFERNIIIANAWPYVAASWAVFEGSPETSGIPAVFLLKSLLLVFAGLIALQGLSMAAAACAVIRDETEADGDSGGGEGAGPP